MPVLFAIASLLVFILIVATALYAAPRLLMRPTPSTRSTSTRRDFPPGFLWGSGEDAYQHEGGNDRADWFAWERTEPRPFKDGSVSGACADFWNRYDEDFDRAAADGHNAHRIGIEWSRVEPREGEWDEAAWTQYRAMVYGMKKRGFAVFVNLWHFTLPAWAAAKGGWENPALMARWEAYAAEAACRLGDAVDWWSTMIDAQIYALRAYALAEFPPLVADQGRALAVMGKLVEVHVAGARAIKANSPRGAGSRVGQIWFFSRYESRGNPLDRLVTSALDSIFNRAILDAFANGRFAASAPAGASVTVNIPGAKGALDWLGVNYYYREIVSFSPRAAGFVKRTPTPGAELSEMGWEIYPRGLYELCVDLAARYPGLPLVITENGIADATDSARPRFIVEHLEWLRKAIDEGIPVLGYLYWSMTDNLEWLDGFTPRFGLYRVDRATMARERTRSAAVFSAIARTGRLPTDEELEGIR
ncbi:MAG: family 1 glycosylhydrolase [Spirochaetes bacterium]|nr:family 1 glycosylhydrolase [Spirochaetota bacterium]